MASRPTVKEQVAREAWDGRNETDLVSLFSFLI